MQHWYPTQTRAHGLTEELLHLEAILRNSPLTDARSIRFVSSLLSEARRRNDFPFHQLPRWMWIGSLFRLNAPVRNAIAFKCGAAVTFLGNSLSSGLLDEAKIQDLNWVLDSTVGKLSPLLEPNELRTCLSAQEILSIGKRILQFCEPTHERLKLGDTLTFRIGLHDPSMAEPVYSAPMTVTIVKEEEKPTREPRDPKKSGSSTRGLPPFQLLTKEGREINGEETEAWPDGFAAVDGGLVRDLGEGKFKYLINYDNSYHLKYRMKERGDIARDVVTEKYILGMRIVMLAFEHALRNAQKRPPDADGTTLDDVLDEIRQVSARAAASTVLALAENLPKIVDASAVRPDDVE